MICPKCKHEFTRIIDSQYHLDGMSIARKCRNVLCGHTFSDYGPIIKNNLSEITKKELEIKNLRKNNRKVEARTEWQDFRFLIYAGYLIGNVYFQIKRYLQEEDLVEEFVDHIIRIEEIKSTGKVIKYKLQNDSNGEIIEFTIRGLKAHTIRMLMDNDFYWENFKRIFKREATKEDKAKEYLQFAKSLVHKKTGIRSEKYNLEFFKKNPYIFQLMHTVGNEKEFWRIWTNLH